jgi:peptide/nickel transport system permease protein
MSDTPAIAPRPDADAAPASTGASYSRQITARALAGWGARVGLCWIVVLALLAVFAPILANSRPALMKTADGRWSSPMIAELTAADITLLAGAAAAAALAMMRRLSLGRRAAIWFAVVALVAGGSWALRPRPGPVVHETYRDMQRQGLIAWAIYAPIPYSPTDRLRDADRPGVGGLQFVHWFGVEDNGADVASRIIHASRIAMSIGFIATGIAVLIGVFVGGFMGFLAGRFDLLGMRLVEILESIPTLFLLLILVAFFGRNLYLMMVIIGLVSWSGYARYIRAEFLKLRNQDFVHAAVACGLPTRSILFRHMLPNGITPVLVNASFGIPSAILAEATLSFLGLGLVDEPSWGEMLSQAIGSSGTFHWWMAVYPGGVIFLTVLAYNLVGEAFRDAIDPHLRKSAHL